MPDDDEFLVTEDGEVKSVTKAANFPSPQKTDHINLISTSSQQSAKRLSCRKNKLVTNETIKPQFSSFALRESDHSSNKATGNHQSQRQSFEMLMKPSI